MSCNTPFYELLELISGGTLSFRFSRFSSDFALVAKAKSRIEASDFWLKPFDFSTAISYGLKPFDFYASPIKHSDFDVSFELFLLFQWRPLALAYLIYL